MSHINILFISLEHVVFFLIELTETLDDLVLAWIVNLLKCFLHLSLELYVLVVDFGDSLVFGVNQELEVLAFLLKLPKCSLPLEVTGVSLLLGLNDLVMQLVILFDKLLVFLLKR